MPQWLVIGISGVTCGGKTTLAHNLRDYFQSAQHRIQLWNTPYKIDDVQLISQDDYFLPVDDLRHKWIDKLNAINFELITSLDMKQMLSDIAWTMKGRYLANDPLESSSEYYTDLPSKYDHYTPASTKLSAAAQQYHQHQQHQQQQQYNHSLHQRHAQLLRINAQVATQLRDNKINILLLEGFMIFNQPELLTLCNIKFHFHLPYEKCYERRRLRTYDPPDVTGYFEMCVWPHYEHNFGEFRDRKDITFLNGEISKEKIFKFVLQKIITYFEQRCEVACPPPHKLLASSCSADSCMAKACPMEQ